MTSTVSSPGFFSRPLVMASVVVRALYATLVVAAAILAFSGNGPSVVFRRAVILNDDESFRREIDDTIRRADRVKARSHEEGQ